jgi:hypothetical protein
MSQFDARILYNWIPSGTAKPKQRHVSIIFNEIGGVKNSLYEDGVRYFQFPNYAGTGNVFDWKTGDKWSVEDPAPYYFRRNSQKNILHNIVLSQTES